MSDPVMPAADGHSYERKQIERWLATKSTSPMTGEALQHTHTFPNHALRRQSFESGKRRIERFVARPRCVRAFWARGGGPAAVGHARRGESMISFSKARLPTHAQRFHVAFTNFSPGAGAGAVRRTPAGRALTVCLSLRIE